MAPRTSDPPACNKHREKRGRTTPRPAAARYAEETGDYAQEKEAAACLAALDADGDGAVGLMDWIAFAARLKEWRKNVMFATVMREIRHIGHAAMHAEAAAAATTAANGAEESVGVQLGRRVVRGAAGLSRSSSLPF